MKPIPLYPLKFHPIPMEKVWGGEKIRTILGRDFSPLKNCGESWEISGIKGRTSQVANGLLKGKRLDELIRLSTGHLTGRRIYEKFGEEFPLLVKFIDARNDLSIQVHPDDTYARRRYGLNGKTEMWYVLQADPGAELICGFNRTMDKATFIRHLEKKTLPTAINREKVKSGDVFFLPPGKIHAIGKGILLAEIQQTSDITYRIYDWDRPGPDGSPRELHTEEALEVLNFHSHHQHRISYRTEKNRSSLLVRCPYFETRFISVENTLEMNYSDRGSFSIYVCVQGQVRISWDTPGTEIILGFGETLLLPACIEHIRLVPSETAGILETFIRIE